jgi:hypothetical protein
MARVQVYRIQLTAQTTQMARRFADIVLTEAQEAAKINAATGPYSKGELARSIHKSGPRIIGKTIHGSIGSRLVYAASVEKGAVVHNIFPKGAPHVYRWGQWHRAPKLKFIWRGRVVYMNQIPGAPTTVGRSHPGQQGKHYLANALLGVAARHNLQVIIFDV